MNINKLAQRLQKDRPLTMVSIRMPNDVIDDLKRVAPMLGLYRPRLADRLGTSRRRRRTFGVDRKPAEERREGGDHHVRDGGGAKLASGNAR